MASKTLDHTHTFAQNIVSSCKTFDSKGGATVITISGPLGAGKTALVKSIAETLGVVEVVTSPTFVLRSDYITTDETFSTLIHIDVYRLTSPKEVETIGFSELLTMKNTLLCIEWPERIEGYIPPNSFEVFVALEGTTHVFTMKSP